MIPGYCYAWLRAGNEDLRLAETSVGTGMTWSMAIEGEMKLLEEIIHRVDMIYSGAPYHILSQWLLSQASIDEKFKHATKHYYEIIEASYRTHLQLSTAFSKDMVKMDEDFFRKLAKTDETYQELVEYNKNRHLKTTDKLMKIYQKVSKGYAGPEVKKTFELGGSRISYQDMLQHSLLSNVVNAVLNSDKPNETIDYFVGLSRNLEYDSIEQLNKLLKSELQNSGYRIVEGDELHSRIFGGYYLITKAFLTRKVKVIIETMQELLGWLSGSAFYNVFQVDKNKNHVKFHNLYEILFSERFSTLECFVVRVIHKLVESLPKDQNLTEDSEEFSKCGNIIGEALMKFFLEIEKAAYNMKPQCLGCNDIFKRMRKIGQNKKPLAKNKDLWNKSIELYGEWVFNEIFGKSTTLSQKLQALHILN